MGSDYPRRYLIQPKSTLVLSILDTFWTQFLNPDHRFATRWSTDGASGKRSCRRRHRDRNLSGGDGGTDGRQSPGDRVDLVRRNGVVARRHIDVLPGEVRGQPAGTRSDRDGCTNRGQGSEAVNLIGPNVVRDE